MKAEGKVDEAIALWEKMVKQNPGANAGTVGLATTYLERKEYAKALPYFEELAKSDPAMRSSRRAWPTLKQAAKAK